MSVFLVLIHKSISITLIIIIEFSVEIDKMIKQFIGKGQ